MREEADARVEALRVKLCGEMEAHTGGDPDRAKLAADAIVEQSEARSWREHFRSFPTPSDRLEYVRVLSRDIAAFEAGRPLSAAAEQDTPSAASGRA